MAPPTVPIVDAGFPVYTLCGLDDGFVVVGGGGGTARSGIPNRLVQAEEAEASGSWKERSRVDDLPDVVRAADVNGARNTIGCGIGKDIVVFSLHRGKGAEIKKKDVPPIALDAEIKTVRFSPDGKWFAAGCEDGTVVLVDAKGWSTKKKTKEHTDGVFDVDFDRSGSLLATASADGRCIVWRLPELVKAAELKHRGKEQNMLMRGCRFSPINDLLFTIETKKKCPGYLSCWQVEDNAVKHRRTARCHKGPCTVLSLSADGEHVGVGNADGEVAFCSGHSLRPHSKMSLPTGLPVMAIDFDENTMISSSPPTAFASSVTAVSWQPVVAKRDLMAYMWMFAVLVILIAVLWERILLALGWESGH